MVSRKFVALVYAEVALLLPLSRLGIVRTSSALLSLLARFKACSEVHRDEQSDFEPLDELSATKGIAISDTPIYGEYHHIETVGNLADVLQLAKELLLVSYRIERLFHLKAVSLLIRIVA